MSNKPKYPNHHQTICRYFNSSKGCKYGPYCHYKHALPKNSFWELLVPQTNTQIQVLCVLLGQMERNIQRYIHDILENTRPETNEKLNNIEKSMENIRLSMSEFKRNCLQNKSPNTLESRLLPTNAETVAKPQRIKQGKRKRKRTHIKLSNKGTNRDRDKIEEMKAVRSLTQVARNINKAEKNAVNTIEETKKKQSSIKVQQPTKNTIVKKEAQQTEIKRRKKKKKLSLDSVSAEILQQPTETITVKKEIQQTEIKRRTKKKKRKRSLKPFCAELLPIIVKKETQQTEIKRRKKKKKLSRDSFNTENFLEDDLLERKLEDDLKEIVSNLEIPPHDPFYPDVAPYGDTKQPSHTPQSVLLFMDYLENVKKKKFDNRKIKLYIEWLALFLAPTANKNREKQMMIKDIFNKFKHKTMRASEEILLEFWFCFKDMEYFDKNNYKKIDIHHRSDLLWYKFSSRFNY